MVGFIVSVIWQSGTLCDKEKLLAHVLEEKVKEGLAGGLHLIKVFSMGVPKTSPWTHLVKILQSLGILMRIQLFSLGTLRKI